jgi:hypothetical protein
MTAGPPRSQLVMQYPIALPRDYDMDIIRERVRTRGGALDERAGLTCKAYCIREAGIADSQVNQYAPFYVWNDAAAAADFLWHGTGFDGIVRDFGRPAVNTWVPEVVLPGPAPAISIHHALFRRSPVSPDDDLVAVAERLTSRVRTRATHPGVHLAVGGIEPTTWQAVEFSTVADVGERDACDTVYTVLHISQPTWTS